MPFLVAIRLLPRSDLQLVWTCAQTGWTAQPAIWLEDLVLARLDKHTGQHTTVDAQCNSDMARR